MSHVIQLSLHLTDDLILKDVCIDINTTELKSDSKTLEQLAIAIVKAVRHNRDHLVVQDMLAELEIDVEK